MITENLAQGGRGGFGQVGGASVYPGTGGLGMGGAIFNSYRGTLALTRCTLFDNTAQGGIGGDGGRNSFFTLFGPGGNGGTAFGGAILSDSYQSVTLTNCTFSNNHAQGGRGGLPWPLSTAVAGGGGNAIGGALTGPFTLESCTISGNSANGGMSPDPLQTGAGTGGGCSSTWLPVASSAHNSVIARNTVSGNWSSDAPDVEEAKSFISWVSYGWNLIGIEDGSSGCPLAGSPARDKGFSTLATDARSGKRVVDFSALANAPGGNGADIGALEVDSLLEDAIDLTTSGAVARVKFKTDPGNTYRLQQASGLGNTAWTNVLSLSGNGDVIEATDTVGSTTRRFYRVLSDPATAFPPAPNGPGWALSLDGVDEYVDMPVGVWFSGDFTVEGWVYVRSYNNWSRLLDFGNTDGAGVGVDSVLLALSEGTTGKPHFHILSGSTIGPGLTTPNPLPLNQWSHLAGVLSGTTGTIYVNGVPVVSGPLQRPSRVLRLGCYLGRSTWITDAYANAIIDEVRIWNVARSTAQILGAMRRQLPVGEVGLLAAYRFDDGHGTIASETASSGPYATLVNGPAWVASSILPFSPTVTTLAPNTITTTSTTLNGSANPNGSTTTGTFEWGPTTSLGNVTTSQSLGSGTAKVSWNRTVTGLTPGATYYYRAVGTNSHGSSTGEILAFH